AFLTNIDRFALSGSHSLRSCPSAPIYGCLRRYFLEVASTPPLEEGNNSSLMVSSSAQHPAADFFQRVPDPDLDHRSTPGEIEIRVIEWPRFQPRGVRSFTNGVVCQFPPNENRSRRF